MAAETQPPSLQEKQPEVVAPPPEAPYTIFTSAEKRFIILMVSLGACFSPLSSNIYYPALNTLATDLKVSESLINLSLTTYMVMTPSLTAAPMYLDYSDCPRTCTNFDSELF